MKLLNVDFCWFCLFVLLVQNLSNLISVALPTLTVLVFHATKSELKFNSLHFQTNLQSCTYNILALSKDLSLATMIFKKQNRRNENANARQPLFRKRKVLNVLSWKMKKHPDIFVDGGWFTAKLKAECDRSNDTHHLKSETKAKAKMY